MDCSKVATGFLYSQNMTGKQRSKSKKAQGQKLGKRKRKEKVEGRGPGRTSAHKTSKHSSVWVLRRTLGHTNLAAMANPLRQRLSALLARPSTRDALMASRPATTKRFFAASAHKHDDAGSSVNPLARTLISRHRIFLCIATRMHRSVDSNSLPESSAVHSSRCFGCAVNLGLP